MRDGVCSATWCFGRGGSPAHHQFVHLGGICSNPIWGTLTHQRSCPAPFPPLGMTPPNTLSNHDLRGMDVPQHETEFCVYFNRNGGIVYNICPHECHNSNNLLLVTGDHVHCGYCGTAIGKKNVKWHLNGCAVYRQLSARAPLASAAAPSPSAPRASAPSAPLMSLVSTFLPLQPSATPSCASTPTLVSAGQLILQCTSEGSSTTRDTVRTATKSVGT